MTAVDVFQAVVGALGALVAIYVVVRVASAAFFRSKLETERNTNGTQKHPR